MFVSRPSFHKPLSYQYTELFRPENGPGSKYCSVTKAAATASFSVQFQIPCGGCQLRVARGSESSHWLPVTNDSSPIVVLYAPWPCDV